MKNNRAGKGDREREKRGTGKEAGRESEKNHGKMFL